MDEEQRTLEEKKFKDNDSRIKTELRVKNNILFYLISF